MLVYTTGSGVNGFTLDPAVGEFFLSHPRMAFPEAGSIYSINDALIDSSPEAVKRFISGCREATGAGLKARYIGSLVTDFHRNLIKGGIYLYPSTISNTEGKLRLTYECNPLAFLAQQAGGTAEDNDGDILTKRPKHLHERSPFYVGSVNMVHGLRSCWLDTEKTG
jgi:fructose-1,6-bisphosphatase I